MIAFKQSLNQILDKQGFAGTNEVLRSIESSPYQYNKATLADLRNRATEPLTALAPMGYLVALRAFIDTLQEEIEKPVPIIVIPKNNPITAQDAAPLFIEKLKALVKEDELEESVKLLQTYISPISKEWESTIIIFSSRLTRTNKDIAKGIVSRTDANLERNQVRAGFLSVLEEIAEKLSASQENTSNPLPFVDVKFSNTDGLEKIIGEKSNLESIAWLLKGLNASKSVCRVVLSNGEKGTGFVVKGGYLFTNHHVIYNKNIASKTKIEFNYEVDAQGNPQKIASYFLDENEMQLNQDYDYCYIKIKDIPENPLEQWGYLEIDTFSEPQIGEPAIIIQHPAGGMKQISFRDNDILAIWEHRLFYETDTLPGSSGSPVFNKEWKVVALHHAGKTENGGIQINAEGKKMPANEGILMKNIMSHLHL